jgi:tRNA modification GTPase
MVLSRSEALKKTSPFPHFIEISAKTGEGIEGLLQEIPRLLLNDLDLTQEVSLTQLRHKKALEEGEMYLLKVIEELHNKVSPEWLTFDLKSCLGALRSIMGLDITESILSSIFSKFCIGK